MWKELSRIALASVLWATGVMSMVLATIDREWLVLAGWGVLAALGGSLFIIWHLLVQERTRVATIARWLAARDSESAAEGLRKL